jgi:flagellar hook-associated protein 2
MVTQIQLGNIFSQNGRRVVTGGASGFDVEGLIKGIIEARRQPAVTLEKNIESNTKVAEAFGEMRTKLNNFRDAANFLRRPPGVANASDNIFEYRTSSLSATNGADAGNFLSVITKPGAKVTDYQIEVKQLATSNVHVTNTINVADLDTAVVGVGAGFALQAGALSLGASGTTVNLNAGDSLAQVVAKINAAKGASGVEADTIKIADGQYRLSLKTIKTGASQEYSLAASPIFSNIGFAVTQSAQDSIMNLDGTDIQRSSNSFDDVVKGVAFTLKQVTPIGTKVTTKVEADLEIARTGIVNFVNAYNEFRLFSSKQNKLGSDGRPLEDSVLASNSTLNLVNSRISGEIASVVNGILSSSDPDRLADIGIKFSDFPGDNESPFTRNILTIDEDALKEALQTNFEGVRRVFEFDYSANDSNFQIFTRTNDLSVSNFTVDIIGTNYTATYTDDLGVVQTVALDGEVASGGSGVVLKGRVGTPLSGLSMIYGASGDASIDVNVSQGLGDRLFNSLDDVLKKDTGVLDVELSALSSREERAKTRISTIDQQLERYREQLLSQFSALERALTSANRLLQTLDAQANANANR